MHYRDEYEIWLCDLEQIQDREELARTLHKGGATPNGDARLMRLFRIATSGNGPYALLLRINCEPA
jgi:hypothetical protein